MVTRKSVLEKPTIAKTQTNSCVLRATTATNQVDNPDSPLIGRSWSDLLTATILACVEYMRDPNDRVFRSWECVVNHSKQPSTESKENPENRLSKGVTTGKQNLGNAACLQLDWPAFRSTGISNLDELSKAS